MTITPGPNNIMIMASGLNFGIKKSIQHLLGIAFGFPLMLVLVGYGLIELINSSRYLYYPIKVFSFTYLVYLAYRMATTGDIKSAMHPFINFIIAKDRYTKGVETILNEWIGFKHYHHQYNLAQMFK